VEIAKFFEILAQYLNFYFDFVFLRGIEKYTRLGSISPELVSYFVIGVLVAYAIASIKRVPGYERKIPSGKASSTTIEPAGTIADKESSGSLEGIVNVDMASFVVLSIAGGVYFHGCLVAYHKLFPTTGVGNIKDTLNAVFAVNAIFHPLNALLKQTQRVGNVIGRMSRGFAIIGAGLMFCVSAIYFAFVYYWIYALAGVHGTTRKYMIAPMVLAGAIPTALIILIAIVGSRNLSPSKSPVSPVLISDDSMN